MLDEVNDGIIIQQVNAQGVMGSGIAKAIRDKWPAVWNDYSRTVQPYPSEAESQKRLGKLIMTVVPPTDYVGRSLVVASIVGQQFYGQDGKQYTSYDALDRGLTELATLCRGLAIQMHYPLIGSDRGGAHWPVVKAIINHRLREFDHRLWLLPGVCEPT